MLQLNRLSHIVKRELKETFVPKTTVSIIIGTAITTFGLYNVHQQADITEGGILGLILLLNFWLGMSSSLLSPVLDFLSYLMGFKYLGKNFKDFHICHIVYGRIFPFMGAFSSAPPQPGRYPFAASVLGGCFIGIGCGLVVRQGASCAGDDALALVISKITGWRISRAYLFTDLTVLILSLSYIPLKRIIYSLITVTISSYLIDFITRFGQTKENTAAEV